MLATAGEGITLGMAVPSAEAVPLSRSDSFVSSLQLTSEPGRWLPGSWRGTFAAHHRIPYVWLLPCPKCPLVLSTTVIPGRVINIFWLYWHKLPHSGIFHTIISLFYFLHFIPKLSLENANLILSLLYGVHPSMAPTALRINTQLPDRLKFPALAISVASFLAT